MGSLVGGVLITLSDALNSVSLPYDDLAGQNGRNDLFCQNGRLLILLSISSPSVLAGLILETKRVRQEEAESLLSNGK
jgi:hypothetical protein